LERNHLIPGQCRGAWLLKQDESRHIAYGVYLISRCLALYPDLWSVVEETMNALLPSALGVIGETFAAYERVPFELVESEFIDYALTQFGKRIERLEKSRGASLGEIERVTRAVIE
jgi:ribonucleoside-diphosphate reductase beta chain